MKEKFQEEIFQHQAIIHKICRMYRDTPEDREDLLQEITYQLWKAYPQFMGRSKISTWMYRIGLNTAMAAFRKLNPATSVLDHNLENFEVTSESSEDDRREKLVWAVKKMNEADRAIITLYLDDRSYQEISEIIGISENNVGVRLNRIKEKIKKLLNISK